MKLFHVENNPLPETDPYHDLAMGVISRAADDYRSLGHKLVIPLTIEEKKRVEEEMKSISRFFLSKWYSNLSGLENGGDVLEALDEEVFGIEN